MSGLIELTCVPRGMLIRADSGCRTTFRQRIPKTKILASWLENVPSRFMDGTKEPLSFLLFFLPKYFANSRMKPRPSLFRLLFGKTAGRDSRPGLLDLGPATILGDRIRSRSPALRMRVSYAGFVEAESWRCRYSVRAPSLPGAHSPASNLESVLRTQYGYS